MKCLKAWTTPCVWRETLKIPSDCDFWLATDWQKSQCNGIPNWVLVAETMQSHLQLAHDQLGMLFPTTPSTAGSCNNWDIQQVLCSNVHRY